MFAEQDQVADRLQSPPCRLGISNDRCSGTGTGDKTVEGVEVLAREIDRVCDNSDVLVVAAGLLTPVVRPGDDYCAIDDAKLVMHGRRIVATRR